MKINRKREHEKIKFYYVTKFELAKQNINIQAKWDEDRERKAVTRESERPTEKRLCILQNMIFLTRTSGTRRLGICLPLTSNSKHFA